MAIPLLWIGASLVGAGLALDSQSRRHKIESRRRWDPSLAGGDKPKAMTLPSEWQSGLSTVSLVPGSVVACHVYGVVEHTGIYLGEGQIAELHGSGLVRSVSFKRFLKERTGERVFVCADRSHQPLVLSDQAVMRAASRLYTYQDYQLFDNNCHRFVYWCLTGQSRKLSDFGAFNQALAKLSGEHLFWDLARE
ncbi:lecithin retinol acyltransferase family protein [Paraferrimonas sedimenticola]|uniref:LRAT domain-containing protein n=1 Tax=Paraferrimonas sedimenticola TaxID=375674 RepID=A0AA37W2P5_9GAMM|nr:lecithin retinol acyltransferase family protein [Paraferrimonas sedimenticola]GLP97933.1 hypothetical protein GCM10007895_32400 [Paraferrimonas sedimenticola]